MTTCWKTVPARLRSSVIRNKFITFRMELCSCDIKYVKMRILILIHRHRLLRQKAAEHYMQ